MAEQRNYNAETVDTDSPAPIAHALRGIDFPCDKEGLKTQARENDAREEVLEQIDRMPDQEYGSMADVFAGVGQANKSGDRDQDRKRH